MGSVLIWLNLLYNILLNFTTSTFQSFDLSELESLDEKILRAETVDEALSVCLQVDPLLMVVGWFGDPFALT